MSDKDKEIADKIARYCTTHERWDELTKEEAVRTAVMVILTDEGAAREVYAQIEPRIRPTDGRCYVCRRGHYMMYDGSTTGQGECIGGGCTCHICPKEAS